MSSEAKENWSWDHVNQKIKACGEDFKEKEKLGKEIAQAINKEYLTITDHFPRPTNVLPTPAPSNRPSPENTVTSDEEDEDTESILTEVKKSGSPKKKIEKQPEDPKALKLSVFIFLSKYTLQYLNSINSIRFFNAAEALIAQEKSQNVIHSILEAWCESLEALGESDSPKYVLQLARTTDLFLQVKNQNQIKKENITRLFKLLNDFYKKKSITVNTQDLYDALNMLHKKAETFCGQFKEKTEVEKLEKTIKKEKEKLEKTNRDVLLRKAKKPEIKKSSSLDSTGSIEKTPSTSLFSKILKFLGRLLLLPLTIIGGIVKAVDYVAEPIWQRWKNTENVWLKGLLGFATFPLRLCQQTLLLLGAPEKLMERYPRWKWSIRLGHIGAWVALGVVAPPLLLKAGISLPLLFGEQIGVVAETLALSAESVFWAGIGLVGSGLQTVFTGIEKNDCLPSLAALSCTPNCFSRPTLEEFKTYTPYRPTPTPTPKGTPTKKDEKNPHRPPDSSTSAPKKLDF